MKGQRDKVNKKKLFLLVLNSQNWGPSNQKSNISKCNENFVRWQHELGNQLSKLDAI